MRGQVGKLRSWTARAVAMAVLAGAGGIVAGGVSAGPVAGASAPTRPVFALELSGAYGTGTFTLHIDGFAPDAGTWDLTDGFVTLPNGSWQFTGHGVFALAGGAGTLWVRGDTVVRPGPEPGVWVETGRFAVLAGDGVYRDVRAVGDYTGVMHFAALAMDAELAGEVVGAAR